MGMRQAFTSSYSPWETIAMLTMNYTYRIYPDAVQQTELRSWLDTCRAVYNYALRELKDWIVSRQCPIDRCSLEKEYIIPADEPFPSYHGNSLSSRSVGGL
ncbi:MAG: helix-turn-helix domain-containing protein [Synechococcales bacterium]|nr:helix-turn-helix domain-containing protein [Synechococcales bacterium]